MMEMKYIKRSEKMQYNAYNLNELLIYLGAINTEKIIRDKKFNVKKANELIIANALILKCDEKTFKNYVIYVLGINKFNKEIKNEFPKLLNHLITYTKFSSEITIDFVNYIHNNKHNIELINHLISIMDTKDEK
jgi:hypothetical protein